MSLITWVHFCILVKCTYCFFLFQYWTGTGATDFAYFLLYFATAQVMNELTNRRLTTQRKHRYVPVLVDVSVVEVVTASNKQNTFQKNHNTMAATRLCAHIC